MGGVVSAIVGGGAKQSAAPGPSAEALAAQKRQADAADQREAETQAQEDARRRVLFGRSAGRLSLISGEETGVKRTLG